METVQGQEAGPTSLVVECSRQCVLSLKQLENFEREDTLSTPRTSWQALCFLVLFPHKHRLLYAQEEWRKVTATVRTYSPMAPV